MHRLRAARGIASAFPIALSGALSTARPGVVFRALAVAAALIASPGPHAADATPAVDANRATQAQLERLRGVGVDLSERILAERDRAPFRDWADFMRRVKGVRAPLAAKLSAEGLTVAGRPFEPATR